MNILFLTALFLCLAYILIQVLYLSVFSRLKRYQPPPLTQYPGVSILVAARNEAANIIECLQSLDNLEYEEGRLEILIGNDQSTDYTRMLTENFIRNKPKFRLINLDGSEYPQTKGKARVLAVLAEAARNEHFLITDADIVVPSGWAKGMMEILIHEEAGMASGTTNVSAGTLFEKFQQVDWLYFMGIIHTFSSIGRPLTVIGNNMAVSRKAYESTGGYGNIPFSITEDYALFDAVRKKGYKVAHKLNHDTMVYSKPVDSVKGVLKQRKRWLTGGWDLPFHYHAMIFVFGAWYVALPILFFFTWKTALMLLLLKDSLQLIQLLQINRKLDMKVEHPVAVLFYELYLFAMIPLTAAYFLLPTKNTWKGRKY